MNAQKAELREEMRAEAKRHSAEERADASRRICERIRAKAVWKQAVKILLFVPTAHEPDIWPLVGDGKQVSLPAFDGKLGRYQAREIKHDTDLVLGQFGIREPIPSSPLADLATLDVVLAPGIAFALDGSRLGRGKGYYDRLLEKVHATKIGVCFDWQVLPRIPGDDHDIRMDHIVAQTLFS